MKAEYQIKIYYKTGDSFHTEDAEELIDYEWNNLEHAQTSMSHIRNHNEYCIKNSGLTKPKGKLSDGVSWDKEYRMIILSLVDDDGNLFKYSCFWTGYFETLSYAEIVIKESSLGSYRP